jgi:hypothetical protein
VNFISLPQEIRGIFVIKAAVEMQNNLSWNVGQANCILKYFENMMNDHSDSTIF